MSPCGCQVRRAAAVDNNKALADQLVAGAIMPESIDGLNWAADDRTGGGFLLSS